MTRVLQRGDCRVSGEIVKMAQGIATAYECVSQNRRHMNIKRYMKYLVISFRPTLLDESHVVRDMFDYVDYEKNIKMFGVCTGQ